MVATREVTYDSDGLTMVGHLAQPDGEGPWPAVLIGHDGVGLDDFQRRRADHLAVRGYVALAMDYLGGRSFFGEPEAMLARALPLLADSARTQAIGRDAMDALLAVPGVDPNRLAALGYGAGGTIMLELTRARVPFLGVAVVHPAFPSTSASNWTAVRSSFLLATGSEDPLCTPAQVLEFGQVLQDAGLDWRVHIYGGAEHAFWAAPSSPTVPGVGHHPTNTTRAWGAVIDFLDEALSGSSSTQ